MRRSRESVGMYFIIEYVDTVTGIEGEALSWEFAKTEGEATIKAKAHLLLFKARFGAQGYRILSPAGSLIACGPGAQDEGVDDPVAIVPLSKGDHARRVIASSRRDCTIAISVGAVRRRAALSFIPKPSWRGSRKAQLFARASRQSSRGVPLAICAEMPQPSQALASPLLVRL